MIRFVFSKRTFIPRPPNGKGNPGSLDIDEERFSVRTERRSGKFEGFESRHDVSSEIEDLALPGQPTNKLLAISIFTDDQTTTRADADIVRLIQNWLPWRFENQFEGPLFIVQRYVLPNLAELIISTTCRSKENAVTPVPASFEPGKCRASLCESLLIYPLCDEIFISWIRLRYVQPINGQRLPLFLSRTQIELMSAGHG